MSEVKDIIKEAKLLSVEEQTLIIDTLLQSINEINTTNDQEWIKIAKQRLSAVRSGKVKPVDGEEVFEKIKERFAS
jgi:putative addiction module component (TIGR02574 family)